MAFALAKISRRCLETTPENVAPSPHPRPHLCLALVMYLVRQIDHPQTSKEVWRSVVSIQRKRAVIACFRQTSLHMMPRYLGIRGQQKIQDPACAASASCSFFSAPFLFLNLHIKVLALSHTLNLFLRIMSIRYRNCHLLVVDEGRKRKLLTKSSDCSIYYFAWVFFSLNGFSIQYCIIAGLRVEYRY